MRLKFVALLALSSMAVSGSAAAQNYYVRQSLTKESGAAVAPPPTPEELVIAMTSKIKAAFLARAAQVGALNVPANDWQATYDANPPPGGGIVRLEGYYLSFPWGHGNPRGFSWRVSQAQCVEINRRLGHGATVMPYSYGRFEACSQLNGSTWVYYSTYWNGAP